MEAQDVLAIAESNVSLSCNASGHPDLEYSWERVPIPFNFTMEDDQDRVSGWLNHTLSIAGVGTADAMNYTCYVSPLGELVGVSTVSLEVQGDFNPLS